MWWKLSALFVLTSGLIFAVIPFRTHAVVYDPMQEPPPERGSFGEMLGNMYLTPGTVLIILVILASASFVGFKVLRGHW